MSVVGIIGDTHIPYELEGYLEFCQATFNDWDVTRVVHIGDLVDHHALSFHENEPSLKSAAGEIIDARDRLAPWYKAFPKLEICNGNHDLIPARQLKTIGMEAEVWMRPLEEIYEMPKGWKLVDTTTIDGVLYHHGYTANGVNGFRNDSIKRMCRTVSGHAHGNAGVSATASQHRLVWGMAVGCGVDVESMAMVYGKHFLAKPIVACGIVVDGKLPVVEYMDLGED
jgi:predicted phosphodiesterase